MIEPTEFTLKVGADMRAMRIAADLHLDDVGEILGFRKDAISKLERGFTNVTLEDYLRFVDFMRDIVPDHPAVPLARKFFPRKSRTT